MTGQAYPTPFVRNMITVSLMAATIMNALDTTIANVALPHMQGSVSASGDEITWVLTSYIVAAAIMTPLSGWLSNRFGRKRVLLASVAGFTAASMLCGIATTLPELVLFRLLQGVGGAALVPMSQAILFDINPPEKHGSAMAIFGMGAVFGPIIGPVLGGWITDNFSWRWCFFINVPVGAITLFGLVTFLSETRQTEKTRFDLFGFAMLGLSVGMLQLVLDRGQQQDWFSSTEICIEAALAAFCLYAFVVHMLTAERPFLSLSLFADVNYSFGLFFSFFVGIALYAVLALLPTMLQRLMGYPVLLTGLMMAPRGVGSLVGMTSVGMLQRFIDARLLVMIGFALVAIAIFMMSGFSLQMDDHLVILSGFLNGFGNGLAFVPLSTIAFATLAPSLRNEASAMFTLVRSLGSAVGISALQVLVYRSSAAVHSRLIEGVRPDNPAFALRHPGMDLGDPAQAAMLAGEVGRQASMVSYVDGFWLLGVVTLVIMPLALLMKPSRPGSGDKTPVHME